MSAKDSTVENWAEDWDILDPAWVDDPYPIWEELRGRCPVAHTPRFNEGTWLPVRFDDLATIAHDTATFSNNHDGLTAGGTSPRDRLPPITSDPPEHSAMRRAVLPFFAPRRIEAWRAAIEAHCTELAEAVAVRGHGDAAVDYAQHIPVGAIAAILGVDPADGDQFRTWIHDFAEVGARKPEVRIRANADIGKYMLAEIAKRRRQPSDDLISHLTQTEVDGQPLDDDTIRRMLLLQLLAGIDTTWSSIGAALWHLAANPLDRQRLVDEPELIPTAVEELLRAYAPVSVVRRVTGDVEVAGAEMHAGDSVLMAFPAACRDPEVFEQADEVVIDRQRNRHAAFGLGIHRCLGSNLARLEMITAVGTWLHHIPEFELAPGANVTWSAGQIRGPRTIPIVIGSSR